MSKWFYAIHTGILVPTAMMTKPIAYSSIPSRHPVRPTRVVIAKLMIAIQRTDVKKLARYHFLQSATWSVICQSHESCRLLLHVHLLAMLFRTVGNGICKEHIVWKTKHIQEPLSNIA